MRDLLLCLQSSLGYMAITPSDIGVIFTMNLVIYLVLAGVS